MLSNPGHSGAACIPARIVRRLEYDRLFQRFGMAGFAGPPGYGFTAMPLKGNLLTVVIGPDGWRITQMPAFANRENLRETGVRPRAPADFVGAPFAVRAFAPGAEIAQDPMTGSLQAGPASWRLGPGVAPAAYVAAPGTAPGRAGRRPRRPTDGEISIGGQKVAGFTGTRAL
jgi:predicted PhzF superfamily epimerase YddE/YHI9